MTSIFGSSKHGPEMKIFKQIGYGISIFFLLLTIAIHIVVDDVRKVLNLKQNKKSFSI